MIAGRLVIGLIRRQIAVNGPPQKCDEESEDGEEEKRRL
jgi:hypothetical protein